MKLTDDQISIILTILVIIGFIFVVFLAFKIVWKIIKGLFRFITSGFRKLTHRFRSKGKKIQGYKNYKGDTWYPDGTVWNAEKKKWEEPDYKNNK